MDRRAFLGLAAVALAAAATGSCARAEDAADDARRMARPALLPVFGAPAVRDIGQRYRELTPLERDPERLRAAIVGSRAWTRRLPWSHPSLEEQVRADFARGRTVIVNGWLLSATEARQCALYSLLRA